MTAFWFSINEPTLHQGDLLPDCLIPEFTETFGDVMQHAYASDF